MKRPALDLLEQRLRTEARLIREKNGFSPILHQRLMAGLRRQGLTPAPVHAESSRWVWRLAGPMAAAAAIALASWLILRPAPPAPDPHPIVKKIDRGIPDMPPIAISRQVDPATTALDEHKYAYLDRDARHLFTFVADQLPDFPSPLPR